MSFITKRERVFNEYDLFDLPARNEGKLKAYSSCTDARAWSHFCSDKTEHLVEVIKRNNETVRPKYIPTDVIVNTLMTSKNAEIARLKRKIEEFEQMLAAYDDLDLTCDQKCEIANAHAAIKAANKELDDMFLDLDISGFTEGIDSEAFETGKSRGDEPSRYTGETGKSRGDEWTMGKFSTPRTQTKGNQIGNTCKCDASTSAHDKRIEELQDTIISKDAKFSAMQNTIAVMENDVCEPYCIYAHIYTALEKIFGTLCQNEKYKQYLDLLTAGRDTRGIDLKGKILFKMKILEKFSLALIAPCSQNSNSVNQECSCYRAEIVTHVETTFALTSAESKIPSLDNKRAQLVADIMQNDDMKEILSKESLSIKLEDEQLDDCYTIENYDLEAQNLKRLKNLQANYEVLLNYYDNLKHEKDLLNVRCQKYVEMEKECECLQNKLREYNQLWKEKEYYRKRSEDLDTLKENYYVLSEETANIENKLQAEKEINKIKSSTVDELRNENIKLENKISEISVTFEKQRNILICKLKECECKMMCQEQQIKSLTDQVDSILRGDSNKISQDEDETTRSIELIEEINSQTEQIKNLKNALCCNEEEKQYFQEELDKKIEIINELKLEIENWKRKYEETNDYIENYLEKYQMEISKLQDTNKTAVENLNYIIQTKSQEINNLIDEVDRTSFENQNLVQQVKSIQNDFHNKIYLFENEKKDALNSIQSARKQSLEILQNIKSYDSKNENESKRDYDDSLTINSQKLGDVNNSEQIRSAQTNNINFLTEVQLLREINQESVNLLQNENSQLKQTFDVANNEIEKLKKEILEQDAIKEKFKKLSESHEHLLSENQKLQADLNNKTFELDNILHAYQVSKKKSETLVDQLHKSESIHGEYTKLNEAYQKVITDRNFLQNKFLQAENQLKELEKSQKILTEENAVLHLKLEKYLNLENNLSDIKKYNNKLKETNSLLQNECSEKNTEINDLCKKIQDKSKENRDFCMKVNELKNLECAANNKIDSLKRENTNMQIKLNNLEEEHSDLKQKLNQFEHLQYNFNELASAHEKLILEKENLQKDLHMQLENVKKLEQENNNLNNESKTLLMHSEDLEKALLRARNESLTQTASVHDYNNNIKNEIDALRKEKMSCHKKIGDLLNNLDELEFLRNNLEEMIISKDKKISTLENHINELEDEIRRLQHCLNDSIETGEQLNQRSNEKIDESFKTIEAHHSKATHNMKIEIAKLQNKNTNLENQLFTSKLLTDESYNKENIELIQIRNLQKERLEIISQIKNLELNSVGDSNLSPHDCALVDVIASLERIKQFIDEKNKYIDNTLINVKASYELLKTKADEAKKIAEEERQKIINEKGELHKKRKNLEDQLENLKKENLNYEMSIKDLQGEIMNQTLVLNRVRELSDMDIKRLKDDNFSLQDLYDKSLNAIKELKEKINTESKDKNDFLNEIEKMKITIKNKCEENLNLTKYVESIKNKTYQDFSNQTILIPSSKDLESQTETDLILDMNRNNTVDSYVKNTSETLKLRKEQEDIKYFEYLVSKNEQPTIDFLKKIYINDKLKKLNLGKLEHYSLADIADISNDNKGKKAQDNNLSSPVLNNFNSSTHSNILDSFTQVTNSFKNTTDCESYISKHQTESLESSTVIDTDHNNEPFYTDNKVKDSMSSTDKDMFLIYKESQSVYDDKTNPENKSWPQKGLKDMIVERAAIYTNEEPLSKIQKTIKNINSQSDYGGNDDDSLKPQLNINLPRVFTEVSNKISSDEDIKSLDSYNETIYDSSKEGYSDTKISNFSKRNKTDSFASKISNMKNDHDKISKQSQEIKNLDSDQHSSISMNFNKKRVRNIHESLSESLNNTNSSFNLSRTYANFEIIKNINQTETKESKHDKKNFAINYMLNSIQNGIKVNNTQNLGTNKNLRKNHSEQKFLEVNSESIQSKPSSTFHILHSENISMDFNTTPTKTVTDRSILVKMDPVENYENKIKQLTDSLQIIERDYKNKMESIKIQYENNIKHIVNEHNQGVENIQNLHEETVREIINKHENEIENLRTLSIEAMRKAEKLENENFCLKSTLSNYYNNLSLDETPVKILQSETKKRKNKTRPENKILTKTIVDAFNVKPRKRSHGPCTCSIDINVSDTIRNIFEQVDVEQRQMAELAYLKYIANKILNDNVEELDAQELSFLHLKVCRTWKTKLNKEESLQKRIDSLENELLSKQRQTQKNMADLDRKVAEEWRRLQEVRESVCKGNPEPTRDSSLEPMFKTPAVAEKDMCFCNPEDFNIVVDRRRSAEELMPKQFPGIKPKRSKLENNRAVLAKLETDQRREKKVFSDETPTRLKRSQDRQHTRLVKK